MSCTFRVSKRSVLPDGWILRNATDLLPNSTSAQSGSLAFLARQGFDFNKWVRLWFHHTFARRAAGQVRSASLSQPSAGPNMSLQCHVAAGLAQDVGLGFTVWSHAAMPLVNTNYS